MADAIPNDEHTPVFSVDSLIKYMGDDDKARAIVAKIVRDACAPGREPLDQVIAAMQQGRQADAGRIFHVLRGSIGSLGAKRFVYAALAFETALSEQRTADFASLQARAEEEYLRVLLHAQRWLAAYEGADGAPT
ncbi:Hpt domain-containing protein [Oxalobacteraceae bacterium]|nr:Hpt domain-containing protein [Oxalobacteraceae bacterium]